MSLPFYRRDLSHEKFSARRIEALTDGVFAIAMTLLVLDLKIPELGASATNGQLWQALVNLQSNIVSLLISFLILGSMWAIHMRQFEYIKYTDRHLTMINTIRLLFVVLVPFTASMAGAYPDLLLGRILFPLNFFCLGVTSLWQWNYATKSGLNKSPKLTPAVIRWGIVRNWVFVIIAGIITVVSAFVGEWAFMLFFTMPVIMYALTREQKQEEAKS